MNIERKQSGFTLVELLLYIAISSTIILAITTFTIESLAANTKTQSIAEVEQQAEQVLALIEQTAHNATGVTSPATGVSAASLTLTTAANSPSVFDLSGGAIRLTEGAGAPVSLTNNRINITGLTFTNLTTAGSPATIRVQFSANYTNNSSRNEFNYSKNYITSFTLRR